MARYIITFRSGRTETVEAANADQAKQHAQRDARRNLPDEPKSHPDIAVASVKEDTPEAGAGERYAS